MKAGECYIIITPILQTGNRPPKKPFEQFEQCKTANPSPKQKRNQNLLAKIPFSNYLCLVAMQHFYFFYKNNPTSQTRENAKEIASFDILTSILLALVQK